MTIQTTIECVEKTFCLSMAKADFLTLMRRDEEDDKPLYSRLEELKFAGKFNYDGHFGPHVWYTLDAENDTPANHNFIRMVIVRYIEGRS
jgi:hypothetical protein